MAPSHRCQEPLLELGGVRLQLVKIRGLRSSDETVYGRRQPGGEDKVLVSQGAQAETDWDG